MKRIVALKVLAPNLSSNETFVQRFQREVETIARLGHPNIVMAYDADESEAGHFLVMEYVNGRDLAVILQQNGVFSVPLAVDCILQAARGLAYTHAQSIVHRDIKPHNLMLDDMGIVKVTDLGLARLDQAASGPGLGTDMTMEGSVMGTVDFMPPEQAVDSTSIDQRADIYSLGATLYYLLTGQAPYTGSSLMAVLLKHREEEIPSLRAVRPEVPAELDVLFRRMMAKNRDERVQSMEEVIVELERISAALAPDGRVPGAVVKAKPAWMRSASATDSSVVLGRGDTETRQNITVPADLSVLIVEPSRAQAAIMRSFLQEMSIAATTIVSSGEEAIKSIEQIRPHVVLTALHLRDMSGLELAVRVRSETAARAPGFILVTSESTEADASGLSRLHRVLMLQKPFTAQQLREALALVTGSSVSQQVPQEQLPERRTKVDRSQLSVLIVDDSGVARTNERIVLQGLGFTRFTEAADGALAIAAATRESFDLIVTDYNMPLMDGRALISYLRQNPATANTPIVMVTTETDPRILDPVRQLGVTAIFDKAFPAAAVGPTLAALF
jgi:serine/threonine protein kinase